MFLFICSSILLSHIFWSPRLALKAILEGNYGELLVTMGVCCSSWVVASRGSSKRSFLTPMGCATYKTVAEANKMVSRSLGLATAICGTCFDVLVKHRSIASNHLIGILVPSLGPIS